jgi:CHAT domain-containing protein
MGLPVLFLLLKGECQMILRACLLGLCLFASVAFAGEDFDKHAEQSEAYLRQGLYRLALETMQAAAEEAATAEQKNLSEGMLGLIHYEMHHFDEAELHLENASRQESGAKPERARWLAALADIRNREGSPDQARQLYAEAASLAAGKPALEAGIRLGLIGVLPKERRLPELQQIYPALQALEQPEMQAKLMINLGTLAAHQGSGGQSLAAAAFAQAQQVAGNSNPRLQAEALDGLAQLYEDQQAYTDALRANGEAIAATQAIAARDLMLDLDWREGRLHRRLGHAREALAAYQRAVADIEAVRDDIPVEYSNGRSSFRDTLEPVYLGLADLLLEQAKTQGGEGQISLLRQARNTVELIKQTEMEDFLGGRCAVKSVKTTLLDKVDPHTVILYPIILPDRLEILANSGNLIRQFSYKIDAGKVQATARELSEMMREDRGNPRKPLQELYRWLIAPAEPWLREVQAQTVVIVPDGVLRLIPFAALHDGQHYLIERYAVAISPGLTLFEPSPLQQRNISSLLAGMSEPGPVVGQLPLEFYQDIDPSAVQAEARGGIHHTRSLPVQLLSRRLDPTRQLEIERKLRTPANMEILKNELRLPGVKQEIESIQHKIPHDSLMNENFTVAKFKQEILSKPYSVVHIASHGMFGNTADSSFIMAYDGVININDLEALLKADKFKATPVELITLSACQTAEGDDRAPLGLSGMALKARVRSALGTLWPVADEVAVKLMTDFYEALSRPGTSKAQALQQAQQNLLKIDKYSSPFLWSPFILVGNWL